ncbi:MAG: hypothetical protein LUG55_03795 [Clostridiales bacterium]|nr:hypothetical protein [Clostridiales bacterium]
MQEWVNKHGFTDSSAMLDYAYALSERYGSAIGALACQMYEATAAAQGVTVNPAEAAATPEYGEVAKAVNGAKKQSEKLVPSTVGRLVKQVGADTTLKNAQRDGAQFAWVPHGDSCAFCLMLASRGWQYMSKKALKNGHAEHIHANCDCQYAVRFDGKSTVEGYDPDKYKEMYDNAEGSTPQEKLNSMRRSLTAETKRRKIGEQGQEIIDKATYNKLTRDFLRRGGIIIRGEEAEQHLKTVGAYASYIVGADTAIIRDDATISDVLEEMYHAEQDRTGAYNNREYEEMRLRREIDAQNYLLNSAKRYKIPVEETEVTRANLAEYEAQLEEMMKGDG